MEGPIVIGIVVAAVVVAVVVVALVARRAVRSRSARTDWLGELSEIRRSSLGDDEEEVTGVLRVVTVDESGDPVGSRPSAASEPEPEPEPEPEGPVAVTDRPDRVVTDADTTFMEYHLDAFGALRVTADPGPGLRIMVDHPRRTQHLMVDLPGGTLWFRSATQVSPSPCSIRTPAGWVMGRGDLLVLADAQDWCYVMCLQGEATIRLFANDTRAAIGRGRIGRFRAGSAVFDVVEVGADALESESAVRRQRRLDGHDSEETR